MKLVIGDLFGQRAFGRGLCFDPGQQIARLGGAAQFGGAARFGGAPRMGGDPRMGGALRSGSFPSMGLANQGFSQSGIAGGLFNASPWGFMPSTSPATRMPGGMPGAGMGRAA